MTKLRRGVVGYVGEGNDAYPNVVAVLNDQTRVVRCPDDVQWIVQRKISQTDPTKMWSSIAFCRSKEALLRCSGAPDHPVLAALPDGVTYPLLRYGRYTLG